MSVLSIIIPVYNSSNSLQICLDSIINQSYTDFEVIIIDDGSTDNSMAICQKYEIADKRFHVYTQDNCGPGVSRNRGLKLAKGKYVLFIDSDDWIEKEYLETIMRSQNSHPTDLLIWGYTIDTPVSSSPHGFKPIICKTKELALKEILKMKWNYEFGFSCFYLFRRDLIQQYKIFFPTGIRLHEDVVFANYYCQHINSLQIINYVGYHYLKYESQSLSRRNIGSAEAYKIAEQLWMSVQYWIEEEGFKDFETRQYLAYHYLSLRQMYKEKMCSASERHKRINNLKKIIVDNQDNKSIGMSRKELLFFMFVPTIIIDFIFIMYNLKKSTNK